MTFPQNEQRPNAFSERRMSPFTASLTSENDRTDVVVKSFDVFHDRVDRAFHSMNPSDVSSSKSLAFWRTSAVLAIRLPGGKHNAEDEEEEDKEQEDSDKEERNDCDCLFGTKKETRKSIGKCDRLDRENEFDGDDMMARDRDDWLSRRHGRRKTRMRRRCTRRRWYVPKTRRPSKSNLPSSKRCRVLHYS